MCVSWKFSLSTASHVENGHSSNRVLDVTILRTFNAFKVAIYLFLKMCRRRRRCMTLIRSPSHYYVSSSSSSCTRIMPNNKNDPRDHSATVIHILRQFQIAHFRIPHSRPEAHSIRPQNKNDTQTHKRQKTTATKKYSFRTNNSLKYTFFPFDRIIFFCLNFDLIWKLYVRARI